MTYAHGKIVGFMATLWRFFSLYFDKIPCHQYIPSRWVDYAHVWKFYVSPYLYVGNALLLMSMSPYYILTQNISPSSHEDTLCIIFILFDPHVIHVVVFISSLSLSKTINIIRNKKDKVFKVNVMKFKSSQQKYLEIMYWVLQSSLIISYHPWN